jgi:hypothetical protein
MMLQWQGICSQCASDVAAPGSWPCCRCGSPTACTIASDVQHRPPGTAQSAPAQEDACAACSTPYVRSSLTHECLPLVEFHLAPDISPAEAGHSILWRSDVSAETARMELLPQIHLNVTG